MHLFESSLDFQIVLNERRRAKKLVIPSLQYLLKTTLTRQAHIVMFNCPLMRHETPKGQTENCSWCDVLIVVVRHAPKGHGQRAPKGKKHLVFLMHCKSYLALWNAQHASY